jgi:hypothetical protein
MYEPWIFASTLAAGGGLVAYSVALQPGQNQNPITPEPPPAAVHVIPPAPPTSVPEPTTVNPVLELEPVVIRARAHQPTALPPPDDSEAKGDTVQHPCSDWRDLGPTHVAVSNTSGAVAVRSLCP